MSSMMSDPEMKEIFESFIIETNEILEELPQDLMLLEEEPGDLDLLNKIFRSFHTIKGTSTFMGFNDIVAITHHGEDILNKLRRSELVVTQDIIDVLLEVNDLVYVMVDNIKNDNDEKVNYSKTIETLDILSKGEKPKSISEDNAEIVVETAPLPENTEETESDADLELIQAAFTDGKDKPQNALDLVLNKPEMFEGTGDFAEDELALIQAAFEESNKEFSKQNAPKETQKTIDRAEIIAEVKKENEAKLDVTKPETEKKVPGLKTKKEGSGSETIRIEVDKLEKLMNLSGELVLGRNRLAQITENYLTNRESEINPTNLSETNSQIDFITTELQTAVMRMRMVQVAKLFQKAPRIIRDLSKEFGKDIKLVMEGKETEIDKSIIEELNDPLVHMIRNSCDHGIETPEERAKEGKAKQGTLLLHAEQEGNQIVLKISDDGKGIDPDQIKEKAIEKEIIDEIQAEQMSRNEILQLIFKPGFSAAKKLSKVSGRGVGMDVVQTNIQKLKGIIEIESEVGKGSTFIIKLPLTLAIIHAVLVNVHEAQYAIPLTSVIEIVSVKNVQINTVNQQKVISIRDDVYPLVMLEDMLGFDKNGTKSENQYVVIVGYGSKKLGIIVDNLQGQREIVIKPLGNYLGNIQGIAGSTILGDGSVILILDIVDMFKSILT